MADVMTKDQRKRNMSHIRGRDTKPEMFVRSLLHQAGFRFRLYDNTLPGKPDIVLKKYKAVIFVDGCFWHRHKGCRDAADPKTRVVFWEAKFKRTVERDKVQNQALEKLGWNVIRIWECELKKEPTQILSDLKERMGTDIDIN